MVRRVNDKISDVFLFGLLVAFAYLFVKVSLMMVWGI